MVFHRNQCLNLNSLISYSLITFIVLIMALSAIKYQESQSKPCCIKGYICKAVMNVVK